MRKIANVFFFAATFLCFLVFAGPLWAGVLEDINNELTGLVEKAEPFLATIKAEDYYFNKLFIGTGILINTNGYVLTTTTVVDSNENITVKFKDGKSYPAKVIGIDNRSGIALLKIEPVNRAVPKLGRPQKLAIGSLIAVIGNCYDQPTTVNFGVFSGVTDDDFLQLSVQSGPGGSGGAVFDAAGRLIGMVMARAAETIPIYLPEKNSLKVNVKDAGCTVTHRQSVGVDIPSSGTCLAVGIDRMLEVTGQLKKYGRVKYAFLGITQAELPERLQKEYKLENGVLITGITAASPAEDAGLKRGDVIERVNDIPVKGTHNLLSLIHSFAPGDKIALGIMRNGYRQNIQVKLSEMPPDIYSGVNGVGKGFPAEASLWLDRANRIQNKLLDYEKYLNNLPPADNPGINSDLDEIGRKLDELERYMKRFSEKIEKLKRKNKQ